MWLQRKAWWGMWANAHKNLHMYAFTYICSLILSKTTHNLQFYNLQLVDSFPLHIHTQLSLLTDTSAK